MANAHYDHFFHHTCHQGHCLNRPYTVKPTPPGAMQLRTGGHEFELLTIHIEIRSVECYICLIAESITTDTVI